MAFELEHCLQFFAHAASDKRLEWGEVSRANPDGNFPERNESNDSGVKMSIEFVVHEEVDGVGVVVVEGLKAGADCVGWIMQEDKTINFTVLNDIPIGHKIALKDFQVGDTVIKYSTDIGRIVAPVKKGEHVHVHNLKTKRW